MSQEQVKQIYEMGHGKDCRNHIGVRNVLQRLKNYYNGQAVFYIHSEQGLWTEVEFYIPLRLLKEKTE